MMRKLLAACLFIAGFILIGVSGWKLLETKQLQDQSMEEVTEVLQTAKAQEEQPTREQFQPIQNESIGILRIPKIDAVLPIVEGTDPDDLKKGVGHYTSTGMPGDGKQILLSGHRDTVFRNFGELEKGDEFIVELPYGTFRYIMDYAKVVSADDTTVIGSVSEEVLNLSTCYPFQYVGDAPERYVIYAYPLQ